MVHLGDFARGETVRHMWATVGLNGASITRGTNGTIVVYKDGGTTESSTGVTDTEDFDTRTGLHLVEIALSDAFYAAGSHFTVVVHTMTVDGQGPITMPLCSFTVGKTGVVAVGTLSGTHSATTADLGPNAPAGDIAGQTLWFPGHQVVRTVDSYVTATGVATFASTAATLVDGDAWILLATPPAGPSNLGAIADAVWDEDTTGHTTAGTFGEQLKTDVDAILDDTGTSGVKVDDSTPIDIDIKEINSTPIQGAGVTGNKWRPV